MTLLNVLSCLQRKSRCRRRVEFSLNSSTLANSEEIFSLFQLFKKSKIVNGEKRRKIQFFNFSFLSILGTLHALKYFPF